jgi:hypothetical protein
MKALSKISMKQLAVTGIMMAVIGCGSHDNGGDANKSAGQQTVPVSETKKDESDALDSGSVKDGKYYLSSGTFEGSDSYGNKIDKQTLQIAGDYFWRTKYQGEDQYEVIATGSAKLSSNNTVLAEVNCSGSQDVYAFDLVESGALRNFSQLESGCPQSAEFNASKQMSIRSLNGDAFEYTVVSQSEGVRITETYVFRK